MTVSAIARAASHRYLEAVALAFGRLSSAVMPSQMRKRNGVFETVETAEKGKNKRPPALVPIGVPVG